MDNNKLTRKKVLVIAYHFPPHKGSSGILRTLKFVRYLPEFGYEPIVLTVNPRAYQAVDQSLTYQLPKDLTIRRAFALNAKRHLSFRGSYFQFMALPDPIASWIPAGIIEGISLILRNKIDLVYSTYPIASAHVIGRYSSRITRCPWVADFRDHLWDETVHLSKSELWCRKVIESLSIRNAAQVVVSTNGIRALFLQRYHQLHEERISVIENGYDEYDFDSIDFSRKTNTRLRLIHAGLLEPIDRNPIPFFQAVKMLLNDKKIDRNDIIVELLGPGNEENYRQTIAQLGLSDVIHVSAALPYHENLKRMAESDILLLFQGPGYDQLVPAKLYEYFRIGRPIFALTSAQSDTARLIGSMAAGEVMPMDQSPVIADTLVRWLHNLRQGIPLPIIRPGNAEKFSRRNQTATLAAIFDNKLKNRA